MVWDSLLVHLDYHFQHSNPSLRLNLLLGIEKVKAIWHLYFERKVIWVLVLNCYLVAYFCENALESTGRSLSCLLFNAGIFADESEIFYIDALD